MEFKQIILKISKVSKIQKIQDKVSSQQNQPQAGKGPGEQGWENILQGSWLTCTTPPQEEKPEGSNSSVLKLRKPGPAQLTIIIPSTLWCFMDKFHYFFTFLNIINIKMRCW